MLKIWLVPVGAIIIGALLAGCSSEAERVSRFIDNANWEFVVAMVAIVISVYAVYTQREHNRLSYKPIPQLVKYNYNNRVKVLLWNKGAGPLFIESFTIGDKHSLIDFVPIETRQYTYVEFFDALVGRVVSPDSSLNLLEFKIREDDNGDALEGYAETLLQIKQALDGMVIHLEYRNIYKDKMKYESETLDFGNLVDEALTIEEIEKAQAERSARLDREVT